MKPKIYGEFVSKPGRLKVDQMDLLIAFPNVRAAVAFGKTQRQQVLLHDLNSDASYMASGQVIGERFDDQVRWFGHGILLLYPGGRIISIDLFGV
jgi:hypothetical protein